MAHWGSILLGFTVLLVARPAAGLFCKRQCYTGLGCFDSSDFFHIVRRPICSIPDPASEIETRFLLYTRSNKGDNAEDLLTAGDAASVTLSNFRGNIPTKVIIHGYTDWGKNTWVMKLKSALLDYGDYNVVVVDWQKGAKGIYYQPAANTWLVGRQLAVLIQFLVEQTRAQPTDFHLIGHSLGAHTAGYAGEYLRSLLTPPGRITGLDPAQPFFENLPARVRLDPTDADFVDAIHTDGNNILGIFVGKDGFGMNQAVGHADFYPNGGKNQPGCKFSQKKLVKTEDGGKKTYNACDHSRAFELLIDSLTTKCTYQAFPCKDYKTFKAGKCSNCGSQGCNTMGLTASKPTSGNVKYYLDTGDRSPYCCPCLNGGTCTSQGSCTCASGWTGATCAKKEEKSCFPGESVVTLVSGQRKRLDDVIPGDHVLSLRADGTLVYSEIIIMIHADSKINEHFMHIQTELDHVALKVTPEHMIYSQGETQSHATYKLASEVNIDDFVFVAHSQVGEVQKVRVVNVSWAELRGVFAPLTVEGTLVVDDVVVSCYAVVESQAICHAAFWPVRALYHWAPSRLWSQSFCNIKTDDLHWFADYLMHSTSSPMSSLAGITFSG